MSTRTISSEQIEKIVDLALGSSVEGEPRSKELVAYSEGRLGLASRGEVEEAIARNPGLKECLAAAKVGLDTAASFELGVEWTQVFGEGSLPNPLATHSIPFIPVVIETRHIAQAQRASSDQGPYRSHTLLSAPGQFEIFYYEQIVEDLAGTGETAAYSFLAIAIEPKGKPVSNLQVDLDGHVVAPEQGKGSHFRLGLPAEVCGKTVTVRFRLGDFDFACAFCVEGEAG